MSSTRRAIRRELYSIIPNLGFNSTADSVAAGSVTDAYAMADTNLGTSHFKGTYIYRPDRTGSDIIKKAGLLTVATGVLAHTGTNYSNTSDTNYEVVGMHPDDLNACIQRALRRIFVDVQVVGTLVSDGDMDASGVTSWTDSNATSSKITTAANVFSGFRSLRVANSSGNGYTQSGTINIEPSEPVWVSSIVRCASGTAVLNLYDVTNSTSLATVSCAEREWQRLWIYTNVGSTTKQIAVRLQGTESNADAYWDHVALYRMHDNSILAPSWLNEQHKFLKFRQARYTKQVVNSASLGGQDVALSRTFEDWYQPGDFSLEPFYSDANPYRIQYNRRSQPMADMWIQGQRPFSDIEPLSADTDTTNAPLDLVLAYSKDEIGRYMMKRFPQDARWQALVVEAAQDVEKETLSRPDTPMRPQRRDTGGRI